MSKANAVILQRDGLGGYQTLDGRWSVTQRSKPLWVVADTEQRAELRPHLSDDAKYWVFVRSMTEARRVIALHTQEED
jgi:hypothetical protein